MSAPTLLAVRQRVPRDAIAAGLLFVAIIWLLAILQVWFEPSDPFRLFTQTTLRTLLVGHFLLCLALLSDIQDERFVLTCLAWIVFIYISYGIYDFVAQIFKYPRFLNALRNNHTFSINQGFGVQGWIFLPRLSSLAAEPSHTAVPAILALYIAARLGGWKRVVLLGLTLLFCVGTFARTIWIAVLGAAGAWIVTAALSRLGADGRRAATAFVVVMAIALPLSVLAVPLLLPVAADADASILDRFDSSRAGVLLFQAHPIIGIGFHGWDSHPIYAVTDRVASSTGYLSNILNGIASYLAALGLVGLVIVYVPIWLILRAGSLHAVEKAWWIGAYSLVLLGGDYLALASTWTVLAVAISGATRKMRRSIMPLVPAGANEA
jgi:O-antigen ligase